MSTKSRFMRVCTPRQVAEKPWKKSASSGFLSNMSSHAFTKPSTKSRLTRSWRSRIQQRPRYLPVIREAEERAVLREVGEEREGAARDRAVLALAGEVALAPSEALVRRELARHGALVLVVGAENHARQRFVFFLEVDQLGRVEHRDRVRVVAADRDAVVDLGALPAAVELDDGLVERAVDLLRHACLADRHEGDSSRV